MQRIELRKLRALMASSLFVIGSRGSKLALWQANWVRRQIESRHPELLVEIQVIKTKGDKILDVPLAKIGGKGLFVKEIEEALLSGAIDMAVHSMKDMPGDIPPGLLIAAIPERENPRDVLISRDGVTLCGLKTGARIGTSSLRRAAQIRHIRPDIEIVSLRGNLDTRLKKLEDPGMDAIILAAAGVLRLGFDSRITEVLDETLLLSAAGQGALCIEIRGDNPLAASVAVELDHPQTRAVVLGERAFLYRLQGGCQTPIAAFGTIDGDIMTLHGLVASLDGAVIFRDAVTGASGTSEALGVRLAEMLLSQGADKLLDELLASFSS